MSAKRNETYLMLHTPSEGKDHVSAFNSKCMMSAIGNTPLIRLKSFSELVGTNVFAKLEYANPTLSAKDRIASYIVSKGLESGKLKPGGTLIDATSGNTGMALAHVSRYLGFDCVLTVADKASMEKVNSLKALGAKVVLCPSKVEPEDPRSYYSQAIALSQSIKGAFYTDQNFNPHNAEAHYCSTGPEIWNQMQGKLTHFVATVGTGGTISGTAKYLVEQDDSIQVIGVDAHGSVLKKYHETGIYDISIAHPYKMEGVGKSIIPGNVNFDIIDQFVKVGDLKSALRARNLAKKDGVWGGHSSGAALEAVFQMKDKFTPEDNIVVIFSDHGSKYLSTIYNDAWLEEKLYTNV